LCGKLDYKRRQPDGLVAAFNALPARPLLNRINTHDMTAGASECRLSTRSFDGTDQNRLLGNYAVFFLLWGSYRAGS
jgi:hypothetical protein